jgi:hypothetical protein
MATFQIHNLPNVLKGDNYNGTQFTYIINGVASNLAGASIRVKFRRGSKTGQEVKDISIGSGITVTDEANGIFQIDGFKVNFIADTYFYDVQVTFSSGIDKTYTGGKMLVIQDVTYDSI